MKNRTLAGVCIFCVLLTAGCGNNPASQNAPVSEQMQTHSQKDGSNPSSAPAQTPSEGDEPSSSPDQSFSEGAATSSSETQSSDDGDETMVPGPGWMD